MSTPSAGTMTGLLTAPYRRGAETLDLQLQPDAAGFTPIAAYGFEEYRARHGAAPPPPAYVLYLKKDVSQAGLQVDVRYVDGGPEQSLSLDVPAGSPAGRSFVLSFPAPPGPALRLTRLRQAPLALGPGRDTFGLQALLGNLARLAWVLGAERDELRRHLDDIARQRHVAFAHGASLDAHGADLRVPRFPPRAYCYDPDTLALYHLDESIPANGVVLDETTRFVAPGHPGQNQGAQSDAPGQFGHGFRVPGAGAAGGFSVPTSPDFDLPAPRSFTVELFAKLEPQGAGPALIVAKGQLDAALALSGPGWSLAAGGFRGVSNNLRFAGSDGAQGFALFADRDLADGRFRHLAGVLDRQARRAVLYVDGQECASAPLGALGALTSAEPLRVGRSAAGHQLRAVLDELRLSRVARAEFDPVLGEGDQGYRRRLGIFRRWIVPSPQELLRTINGLVQVQGQPDSFVLVEENRAGASVGAAVRVLPATLISGASMGADGDPLAKEAERSGLPEDEPAFQEFQLLRHDSALVDYQGVEDHRRMQAVTAQVLERLLARLGAAQPPIAGRLVLRSAYDASAGDLRRVGRALRLSHETLALDALGVAAHAVGFDFVRNDGAELHVSVAAGEELAMVVEARPPAEVPKDGSDAFVGRAMDLRLAQTLPAGGAYRWTLVTCAAGRASLLPHPGDPVALRTPVDTRPRLRLRADAPGEIVLRVEHTFKRRTLSGTLRLRLTLESLNDGETVAEDGSRTASEAEAVDAPEAALNPDYLVTPTLAADFGADPNNKRMRLLAEQALVRLGGLVTASGLALGALQILKAFDPAGTGLHKVGRALRLRHVAGGAALLAALAHQAGFGFVRREGTEVYASVASGPLIEIARAGGAPLLDELTLGVPVDLQARFSTLPAGGSYNWSSAAAGRGSGVFDFVLRPTVRFRPTRTGRLALSLSYFEADPTRVLPYTLELRLTPALDVPGTVILKPQYDLLMNVLNYFHPVGVEVLTRSIREHVVEVRANLLAAFPGYTYPDFRI